LATGFWRLAAGLIFTFWSTLNFLWIVCQLPAASRKLRFHSENIIRQIKIALLLKIRSKNGNFAVLTNMGLTGFDSGQKRFVSMPGFGSLARKS